jgi:hypothetical protein
VGCRASRDIGEEKQRGCSRKGAEEEEERRHVAVYKEEREKKLELVR